MRSQRSRHKSGKCSLFISFLFLNVNSICTKLFTPMVFFCYKNTSLLLSYNIGLTPLIAGTVFDTFSRSVFSATQILPGFSKVQYLYGCQLSRDK